MVKQLFILLTLHFVFMTLLNADGVKATVSNTEIVQGNMLQIQIKASGNRAAFPNIQQIEGLPVLGRHESQNNSFTYINGKMKNERTTTLVLTIAPKQDMTIPSYTVNIDGQKYKTAKIAVKVRKSTAPKAMANNKFSLEIRTDKKSMMVGEPLLATVYFSLRNGTRLSENPQYNKPQFKGFFVKEIEEEKTYREGDRQISELRYILIPQTEGNFTIGPATAKVGVADRNRRDMFGRFFGTTWTPIASNTIDVKVNAKPQESDLVGSFKLESHIDAQSVKANKPVNLTISIEGEGSLEDFDLDPFEIDGVTVYADDASITTNLENNGINSRYSKHLAFISDHDFVIPAHTITVYDTQSKTLKKLEIPKYEITVEGKQKSVAAAPTQVANAGKVQTNLKIPETSMLDGEEKVKKEKQIVWWIPLVAFILGLFVMYLFTYLPRFRWKIKSPSLKTEEALKVLYPHINESAAIEEMVRKLYAKKAGDKNISIDKKVLNEMIAQVSR
jgi:hypothetical protein